MHLSKNIHLLNDLINRVRILEYQDETNKDSIDRDVEMIINRIFPDSNYMSSFSNINFYPFYDFYGSTTDAESKEAWESGKSKVVNLLSTMKKELEWFEEPTDNSESKEKSLDEPTSNKIFIVHGHDEAMKLDVARTIESLGLEAVILHEQDNQGLTVIEKFEVNALNCSFAVVLLSPDDMGYAKNDGPDNSKFRARQNVVLELGYFVGKIGRNKVLPLVKNDPTDNLEIPSDLAGIVYTPYDISGAWKLNLIKSLNSVGYKIDANKLFI